MTKKISSAQMRAARALIRWTALDLARASKVGVATIRRAEVVDGEIPVTLANEAAIRRAFENAGIDFIDDNGGGEGSAFGSKRSKSRNKRWRGAQYARGARYLDCSACPVKATEAVRLFYPSRERRDIDPEGAYCPLNVTWHRMPLGISPEEFGSSIKPRTDLGQSAAGKTAVVGAISREGALSA